jgi:hypothetical protein
MPETLSLHTPARITRTRVIPLPSSHIPLSRCMNQIASQLDEYCIETSSLYEISRGLDILTEQVRDAQCQKNVTQIPPLLEKAVMFMREANMILKMIVVVERSHLPHEMIDHLSRIRTYNDQTLVETMALLDALASRTEVRPG